MILRLLVTQGIISKVFPEKADNFVRDTSDGERERSEKKKEKKKRKEEKEGNTRTLSNEW